MRSRVYYKWRLAIMEVLRNTDFQLGIMKFRSNKSESLVLYVCK